jgi:TolB-like protein/Tfp pilus assembly protein PilF
LSLFAELRRRNVIRMAGLYLVGAWLVVQVAETLLPIFDTPGWVLKSLVVLLAIGFVPALVFSWVYELTPDGIRREGEVSPGQSIAPTTAQRMDRLILVALALVVLVVATDRFWPRTAAPLQSPSVDASAQPVAVAMEEAAAAPVNSIAVLPFVNMSTDPGQDYFSDGISEEILNALVKVRGLQVASRTSSFGFKGQEALGVPAIAEKLSVRHVLEGSVRRVGSTLRITAQLIDAKTDRHLWSESFDRPLTAENVFAIQEEIATAIVAALEESLGVAEVGSVALTHSTANLGAYDLYLRARALFLGRRDLAQAEQWLEQALEQDPDFAKAWELRAAVNSLMDEYQASTLGADELNRRSAQYAERALALDPQSSLALASLARIRGAISSVPGGPVDYAAVIADFERAIVMDPHNVNAMNWLGLTHARLGDNQRSLEVFRKCLAVDNLFGPCAENEFDTLWVLGRSDEAYANMLDVLSRGANTDGYANLHLLAKYDQRAAFLIVLTHQTLLPQWRRGDELYEALRHPERDHSALRDDLLQFLRDDDRAYYLSALLVQLGVFDEPPPDWLMWAAEFKAYRQSPQFRQFIIDSGVLAHWQAHGFPGQCRAATTRSFECD